MKIKDCASCRFYEEFRAACQKRRNPLIGTHCADFEERARVVVGVDETKEDPETLEELMVRKHSDYGPGNIDALGERGVFARVWDKCNRLKRLVWESRDAQVEESVEDTWTDLANYGVIALMVRRGWWGLPFRGDDE